ncbi:hypothetical protein KBB76_00785 [Candidatus Saccharibacteria bacterium]|jgi:hypothetical protein|nr:hypothetical protein [Candidatus Saccharibacteria bacterium]HOR23186.1 hypothetical protein [Candidatus Saccharibacteria bacterium]HPW48359.1 hypothetical protein [Candidatus Saccharibacteria bacterium]
MSENITDIPKNNDDHLKSTDEGDKYENRILPIKFDKYLDLMIPPFDNKKPSNGDTEPIIKFNGDPDDPKPASSAMRLKLKEKPAEKQVIVGPTQEYGQQERPLYRQDSQ